MRFLHSVYVSLFFSYFFLRFLIPPSKSMYAVSRTIDEHPTSMIFQAKNHPPGALEQQHYVVEPIDTVFELVSITKSNSRTKVNNKRIVCVN